MILGCLTIGLSNIGIFGPQRPPYDGLCFKRLAQELRCMRIYQNCRKHSQLCEGLETPLRNKVAALERQLCGLELKEREKQEAKVRNAGSVLTWVEESSSES